MAITMNCPNPACGKALSVKDEYAGMQGKCPFCGTEMTFQKAAPEPIMPTPVLPMGGGGMPPPPPPAPAWESAGPTVSAAGGPVVRPDTLTLVLVSVGLFFLFLLFISVMLPWPKSKLVDASLSGFSSTIGVLLFLFDLLVMGAVTTAFILSFLLRDAVLTKRLLSYAYIAGAWLGTVAVFWLMAGLIKPWGAAKEASSIVSAGFGLWMAFISSLAIAGVFVFLSVREPPELPVSPDPKAFVRRWLLFVCIEGFAGFLGLLIFIIRIV